MWIDLDERIPEPVWPPGIEVRAYRRDADEVAVYEAHQEAFSEEPDFTRDPFDDWVKWSYRDPFDPGLWFVARDGADVAGICLGRPERGGNPSLGWVNILGVRKPWRGRGLGLALLRHAFREFRSRGKARVGLGVDGRNPTAIHLYERAGMTAEGSLMWYVKQD
jgi:mycothiol synthase